LLNEGTKSLGREQAGIRLEGLQSLERFLNRLLLFPQRGDQLIKDFFRTGGHVAPELTKNNAKASSCHYLKPK
jgi:hypothetical protein